MKALRGRNQRYSSQEDAYLFSYREWRNEKVSESWAQFLARFQKKFWVNPRSSASLFHRAERLSGRRHQTLSRNGEMMRHMLKIRRSSLWWTWGRIGQAFGTNARTASGAYKSFLQRNGIDEVQDESRRIIWTISNRRKLCRARHLGHSWEQIARQFGYEEYICIAAHYIHSYGEGKSGYLNASFHPKYFFSTIERTSIYHMQKLSSRREIKDESIDFPWEENIMAQYRRKQSLPILKCDAEEAGASRSGRSQLCFGAGEPVKGQLTFGLKHNLGIMECDSMRTTQQFHDRGVVAAPVTLRGDVHAHTSIKTITPISGRGVAGMRINGARTLSRPDTRPFGKGH